nr:triple geneblock protein 2 [Nerine potexvirus 1]
MTLTKPADYTHIIPIAIVCTAAVLGLLLLTRNNLPSTGDNIHSLPHGGTYQDGTKHIRYCSPQHGSHYKYAATSNSIPIALAIILPAAIYFSSKYSTNNNHHHCSHCSRTQT